MPFSSTTFTSFGQPDDVVTLTETLDKDLKLGELRLQMLYAPINPADINYIQGIYGIKPTLPATPGLEGCGHVIESHSDDFQTGDLVITLDGEPVSDASRFRLAISQRVPGSKVELEVQRGNEPFQTYATLIQQPPL